MSIAEIASYFSTTNLLPELRWAIDAAVNATNVDRVQQLQSELQKKVIDHSVSAPLSLTFAIVGKPTLINASHQLPTLNYDTSNTHIVGNVLGLTAICKVLGLKTFLFSSRLTVKEANQRSEVRQRLAMETVEVRIVFDSREGLGTGDVIELFRQGSILESSLSLPHLRGGHNLLAEDDFPLKPFIDRLIRDAAIESYGGVNYDAKHVKVSEHYITTQYVLFKLLVGAVAGVGTQEYSKMSKDTILSDGASLTSALSDKFMEKIAVFLRAWLEALNDTVLNDRSGYHLSPQVWQALGLTINRLIQNTSLNEMQVAGTMLGALDYSKNATHWSDCAVMELDAKGRVYKNAASSTRQFRVGLAAYFLQVIGGITKRDD
ncbi:MULTISPECIES: hypothetical protein [Vibrio]|uniref:hypothetical protein n=1 Tax=Vibrio TaxID=662 RepID=UPI001142409B|nr:MULTISPECIES: hypothetical protein [Vibrio]